MAERCVPNLTGIPETMLWTLHNRAGEAKRPDGILRDADGVRIYDSIHYDFERSFGKAEASHAIRSVVTDRVLRRWLQAHPDGFVVSLGDGLETQAQRLDNGRLRWLSVDLPEAVAIRERFIPPTERLRNYPASALDRAWMDAVDPAHGVFIIAQGLFMYFTEDEVQRLLSDIAERFPGAELLFDTIPRWFSKKTLKGFQRTRNYRTPPMPWGINLNEVAPTLKAWHPRVKDVSPVPYMFPRGFQRVVFNTFNRLPWTRKFSPGIIHVRLADSPASARA
jgi:O-methyltransferase involved in polyketide biosynthesis